MPPLAAASYVTTSLCQIRLISLRHPQSLLVHKPIPAVPNLTQAIRRQEKTPPDRQPR
jgi:hypothetical protein